MMEVDLSNMGNHLEKQDNLLSLLRAAGWLHLSGHHGGVLKRLVAALRKAEAQCATYWQRDHPLAGDVEVDATSLRKFKTGGGSRLCSPKKRFVETQHLSGFIFF